MREGLSHFPSPAGGDKGNRWKNGWTFIGRELYLPWSWADNAAHRQEAGVPDEVMFVTKPQPAQRMLARVRAVSVFRPWVTGDEVYDSDLRLQRWLEDEKQPFCWPCAVMGG